MVLLFLLSSVSLFTRGKRVTFFFSGCLQFEAATGGGGEEFAVLAPVGAERVDSRAMRKLSGRAADEANRVGKYGGRATQDGKYRSVGIFPSFCFRFGTALALAALRHARARAHISRMNHQAKGINRGTHCKISDSFRIEIMAAAYSRMRIPRVKPHARCQISDLSPLVSPLV